MECHWRNFWCYLQFGVFAFAVVYVFPFFVAILLAPVLVKRRVISVTVSTEYISYLFAVKKRHFCKVEKESVCAIQFIYESVNSYFIYLE